MSSIPETEEQRPPADSVPSRGFRAMFGSLRIRNYRLFCIGQLFANTGQWTQRVAQDWLVLSITGNTTDVGITVALQFIPSLFFSLPGGLIADRYPKRRILQVTQSGIALMDSSQFLRRAVAERAPAQLRDGLRYVRDRPTLLWPTVMVGVFGMFAGNMPVTLAALARYVFRSGAGGYAARSPRSSRAERSSARCSRPRLIST